MASRALEIARRGAVAVATAALTLGVVVSAHSLTIPSTPLSVTASAPPLTMLVVGRDHKLFYEAYNDASDLDEDGTLDIRFKPTITYYGLFDSNLCYQYNGEHDAADSTANKGLFTPVARAGVLKTCSKAWSGNFLNYLTTSRIDALRKVLYGGYREVDTADETILRRAYIPQDAHSWAKEYESVARDGYDISDYTPLSAPKKDSRHFFGSLTPSAGVDCKTLSNCTNRPPWLSVVINSTKRVWEWASTERPVLHTGHGGTRTNYTVRVQVCVEGYTDGCKQYAPSTGKTVYKPVGLLHDYGENDAMLFGLLTGSYNKNMSGGVLRKAIASFASEINADGTFKSDAPIVKSLNALAIRDFNNGYTSNQYRGGWLTTAPMTEGNFVDWGNPVAEMLYETLRYFAGKRAPTAAFDTKDGYDKDVGLSPATWDDPYSNQSSKAKWCSKANILLMSDINPSFDSDQLPGSAFNSFTGDLGSLNVGAIADKITEVEGLAGKFVFVGQSDSVYDGAPTAKRVSSLAKLRGLAPEEPTKQGSYYSAAVAYYGKTTDLNPAKGNQTVDTFVVALASPLPRISITNGSNQTVTLVPFSKSVGGSSIDAAKGKFQPTNQIVDFYVEKVEPGYAKFRINFEDVEQGADHDMDVIAEYEVKTEANGTVTVNVTPRYQAGGIKQNMGYVISGTNRDGVYLVAQDEADNPAYYLNVPSGKDAGYCDKSPMPADCGSLSKMNETSKQNFSPANTGSAVTDLKGPLWYAAKWGAFRDFDQDNLPKAKIEWDANPADNNDTPEAYFLVQNPLKLRQALSRAFDSILDRTASASNITSNSTSSSTDKYVFQSTYNGQYWSGDLRAYLVTANGVEATPRWTAARTLSPSRKVVTWSGGKGVNFEFSELSASDKSALGSEDVVRYVRGDRSLELRNNPSGGMRNRADNTVLGDIVHSSPYYVKDTDTVYVGANDGMLHAFNAADGTLLFSYVPGLVIPNLKALTSPTYTHRFYVDGEIAVSSKAETGKNYLVATLGRGGKGLFALDVTDPGAFGPTKVLWESSGETDSDVGFMLGEPIIAKTKGGKWVVIVANGYNSTSQKAVLLVYDLADGQLLARLDTGVAGDNGLAAPVAYDQDSDGVVDYVYAGDLKGNVWKFDLTDGTPGKWSIALSKKPLFTAKDASGKAQPITAQIGLSVNDVKTDPNYGKLFVFFGTGSYLDKADPSNKAVQTWYGIIDDGKVISGRSELVKREIVDAGVVGGRKVRAMAEATASDMEGKSGWYIDLVTPPGQAEGERIVTASRVYRAVEPVLIASSIIPVSAQDDPCSPTGRGYVNAVNPYTGGATKNVIFDVDRNSKFEVADNLAGKVVGSVELTEGMTGKGVLVGKQFVAGDSGGKVGSIAINLGLKFKGRISWREIIVQ